MITIETVKVAAERISEYIIKTPLLRCHYIEKLVRVPVYLKCENFQLTRSFKARGAFNALLSLSEEEAARGVVTRSSGNFAQAISYASNLLKIPSSIVMPVDAPQTKIDRTTNFGVSPILFGTTHVEGESKVNEIAEREGKVILSPYNHLDVMVGQGTAALEILETLPEVRCFVSPIGGGGLAGGTSFTLKNLARNLKTIGVEPIGASDYFHYRRTGMYQPLPSQSTIADGLRAPVVGQIPLPYLDQFVDEVQTVEEESIKEVMKLMKDQFGVIVEPSGATALAYLLEKKPRDLAGPVVVLISGGNCE